jgi:hypothetical protein
MWDIPSDDLYYVDLVEEEILRTARHVPSRGFGAWKGSGDSQALSVVWVEDLQGTPDDNTVQRLPEYTGTLLPRTLGKTGVNAGGELQATYFYRQAGDREVRGRGDAGLSRSFTLFPSVVFTPYLSLDFLGDVPTSDATGTRSSSGRIVPYGGGDLEMLFRRGFPGTGNERLVHIINPIVSFRYVPNVYQRNIPVYDMWDRVRPQQQVLLSLQQRLLGFNEKGPSEVAFLELSWAFEGEDRNPSESPYIDPLSPFVRTLRDQIDIAIGGQKRDESRSSDIFGLFRVVPAPHWRLSGEGLFDPSEGSFTTAWVEGEWRADEANRVALAYRSTRTLAEDVHAAAKFRPFRLMGLETSANYSIENGEVTEGQVAFTLYPRSECWSVGFVVNRKTRPDETSFRLTFGLGGIGKVGL